MAVLPHIAWHFPREEKNIIRRSVLGVRRAKAAHANNSPLVRTNIRARIMVVE